MADRRSITIRAIPEALAQAASALGEKDRRTFAFLQEQGVVREDTLEPLTRVSLGNIPDFSRKFTIALNGVETVFWRYYLISEEEAKTRAMPVIEERPVAVVAPVVVAPVAAPHCVDRRKSCRKTEESIAQASAIGKAREEGGICYHANNNNAGY